MIKCLLKKSLTLINTLFNFQHGIAQCFSSNQGVWVKLVACNKRKWHIQIKTTFKLEGNRTLFVRSSKFKDKQHSPPPSFFIGMQESKENLVTSILMTQHHLAAGTRGLKIPVCVPLWGRHPAPAPVPSYCATGCFDLSNRKASGMRCARSGVRVGKKRKKKSWVSPPELHFFSREQHCLSTGQQLLPSCSKVSTSFDERL